MVNLLFLVMFSCKHVPSKEGMTEEQDINMPLSCVGSAVV